MTIHPIFTAKGIACDNAGMSRIFDIDVFRRRLAKAMQAKGMKPTTLSLAIGKSPTLIRDLFEKSGDPKLSTVYRIADALHIEAADLLLSDLEPAPVGPSLFVKGVVSAGQWVDCFEWPEPDWGIMTGRPDVTADQSHRFGLLVRGDSMNEVYPDGTYIECVSVFGRAEIAPGKKVVVLRHRDDGMIEATVKELVEIDGELWARPRSTNPAHQAFKLDEPEPGIVETRIAAVVVGSMRPE